MCVCVWNDIRTSQSKKDSCTHTHCIFSASLFFILDEKMLKIWHHFISIFFHWNWNEKTLIFSSNRMRILDFHEKTKKFKCFIILGFVKHFFSQSSNWKWEKRFLFSVVISQWNSFKYHYNIIFHINRFHICIRSSLSLFLKKLNRYPSI